MRFLAFLLFLLFGVFALGARWYFVCELMQQCDDNAVAERPKTLELIEGDTSILKGFEQFVFEEGKVQPELNESNQDFLEAVAGYFKQNPAKNLTITSFYRTSEMGLNSGYYENIGVARAAEVRKLLVQVGIEESRVSLDYGTSEDPSLMEPVLFESYLPSEIPQEFEKVQFTFTNMTFSDANFALGSDEFRPGDSFVLYADSVKQYLEENSETELRIIGHTDNSGTDEYNMDLGKRRAESAREYFMELGVSQEIKIESMGENQPVAPNNTPENRQKNRRVNFRIEQPSNK